MFGKSKKQKELLDFYNAKTLKGVLEFELSNKNDESKDKLLSIYYGSMISLPNQDYVDLFADYMEKKGFVENKIADDCVTTVKLGTIG